MNKSSKGWMSIAGDFGLVEHITTRLKLERCWIGWIWTIGRGTCFPSYQNHIQKGLLERFSM